MAPALFEREREAETECPEAGLGPHSVGKRNTWHNTGREKKNHIYQWSLHNLSSQRHWQLWITIQLVALKKQSACRISGDITPQGRDTELLFLWAMLRSKVSSPFFSGKNIQEHTQMLHIYTVLYKFVWNLNMNTSLKITKFISFPFWPCRMWPALHEYSTQKDISLFYRVDVV